MERENLIFFSSQLMSGSCSGMIINFITNKKHVLFNQANCWVIIQWKFYSLIDNFCSRQRPGKKWDLFYNKYFWENALDDLLPCLFKILIDINEICHGIFLVKHSMKFATFWPLLMFRKNAPNLETQMQIFLLQIWFS